MRGAVSSARVYGPGGPGIAPGLLDVMVLGDTSPVGGVLLLGGIMVETLVEVLLLVVAFYLGGERYEACVEEAIAQGVQCEEVQAPCGEDEGSECGKDADARRLEDVSGVLFPVAGVADQ